jgi:hypothetical protein
MADTTDPEDVARLAEAFPGWVIGARWVTAGTGPDQRRLHASRNGTTLEAWSAADLERQLAQVAA